MKRLFILIICFLAFYCNSSSQKSDKIPFKDKLYYGGGFGLSFGDITNIQASPHVGYNITEQFSAGVKFTFQYIKTNSDYLNDFQTSIYGFGPFARYMLTDQYFLLSEMEFLSLEKKYYSINYNDTSDGRFIYTSVLVGAGIFQKFGERSGMYLALLYNLNDSSSSPYPSPLVIRMGFNL